MAKKEKQIEIEEVIHSHRVIEDLHRFLVDVSLLHEDPRNTRIHNSRSIEFKMQSLTEFGQVKPIIVNNEGMIVAGNGTFAAAKKLGWTKIAAVKATGLTEAQLKAYAIADNKAGEHSEWNFENLATVMNELTDAEFNLSSTGFLEYETQPILMSSWEPPEKKELPTRPEKTHSITLSVEEFAHFNSAVEKYSNQNGIKPTAGEFVVYLCQQFLVKS